MQSYHSRLQTLTAGPESYMNIKKSLSEIDLERLVDRKHNFNKENSFLKDYLILSENYLNVAKTGLARENH